MATKICFIIRREVAAKFELFHLAGHLAASGMNVLLIDADPQGSLSQGFFGSAVVENLAASETLAAIFDDDGFPSLKSLPTPTVFETDQRHSCQRKSCSAQRAATGTIGDETIRTVEFARRRGRLRHRPDRLSAELYQCSWMLMLASSLIVVIPVSARGFATQGLRRHPSSHRTCSFASTHHCSCSDIFIPCRG